MLKNRRLPFAAITLLAAGMLVAPSLVQADNPPPTRIAVINIVKVFASLNAKNKGDTELQTLSDNLDKQEKAKEDAITAARSLLQNGLNPTSQAYQDAQNDLMLKTVDLQAFKQYIQLKLEMEQRLKTLSIYHLINDTVATMCKQRGIALVLVTDDADFSDARSPAELTSRISIRKVLYADPSLDITKDVITQINTQNP